MFLQIKEAEFKPSNKSEEEIKRLTLDEDLSEIERAQIIISKGQQFQKKAIYSNIHQVLREKNAFDKLFKVISDDIQYQDEETQAQVAQSFKKFIEQELIKEEYLIKIFCLAAQILKIWSFQVLNAWFEVIDALILKQKSDNVFNELVQMALNLSDYSQSTNSRYIGARIIGSISTVLKDKIKGPLFDRARSLCQDSEIEVRKIMSSEVLYKICQSISTDLLETYMLEKILELVYDSDQQVKCAAIKMLFEIGDKLSFIEKKSRLCKLFFEFLMSPNEEIIKIMSFTSGRSFQNLHFFISQNLQQHLQFLNLFRVINILSLILQSRNMPQIRVTLFDSILRITSHVYFHFHFQRNLIFLKRFISKCSTQLKFIINIFQDTQNISEVLLASFFTVLQMSQNSLNSFVESFSKLLLIDSQSSLHIIISQYDKCIEIFKNVLLSDINQASQEDLNKFEKILVNSFEMINKLIEKHSWENINLILLKFLKCQQDFKDFRPIHANFVPILQFKELLVNGTLKIRTTASKNLAYYISWIEDISKRDEIIQQMNELFFQSNSFHRRITYILFIEACVDYFSFSFFESQDFFRVLNLAEDKVINVVIRLCDVQKSNILLLLQSLSKIACKVSYQQEEQWEKILKCYGLLKKLNSTVFDKSYKTCTLQIEKRKNLSETELLEYKEWDEILEMTENDLSEKYLKVRSFKFLAIIQQKQMDEEEQKNNMDIKADASEYLAKYRNRQLIFGNKYLNAKYKLITASSSNAFMKSSKINLNNYHSVKTESNSATTRTGKRNTLTSQQEKKRIIDTQSVDKKLPVIKQAKTENKGKQSEDEMKASRKRQSISNFSNFQNKK